MRIARISAAVLAVLCLALTPASAGQKGKGGGSAPTPKTHTDKHPTPAAPTPTTHTTKHDSNTPTPKTHGKSHHDSDRTSTTSSATPTTSAPVVSTLNPIAAKLQSKPLGARIEHMLPAGMTLNTASAGFRNQGQFIAAVHASRNLGIPFADLKAAMIGTPTQPGLSLGQAIQKLKPFANAKSEAVRAERESEHDIEIEGDDDRVPTPSSATPTTSKAKKRGK